MYFFFKPKILKQILVSETVNYFTILGHSALDVLL